MLLIEQIAVAPAGLLLILAVSYVWWWFFAPREEHRQLGEGALVETQTYYDYFAIEPNSRTTFIDWDWPKESTRAAYFIAVGRMPERGVVDDTGWSLAPSTRKHVAANNRMRSIVYGLGVDA